MTCLFALIFTYSFMKYIVLHILSLIVAVKIIVHCFALLDVLHVYTSICANKDDNDNTDTTVK